MKLRRLIAIAVLLISVTARGDAPGVYALTGATVHPVSGPAIDNAVVVIRNGLIESAGAGTAIPADATVIDVKGMHVYPGLIDAQTSLGFAAAPARRGFGGGGGGGAARPQTERPAEPTPDSLAVRNANISDDDAESRRAIGVDRERDRQRQAALRQGSEGEARVRRRPRDPPVRRRQEEG